MGVAIVSWGLVTAVGSSIGLLLFWIGRRLRFRRSVEIAAISGIGVALIAFVPACVLIARATTTTLIDVDPREGERLLSWIGLPANTTSDFCYRRSAVGITVLADFQISETDFLHWMATQKWKVVPFTPADDHRSIPVDGGAITMANTEFIPFAILKNARV